MNIHEFLDYNKETGNFVWKISRRGVKEGRAGYKRKSGYVVISFNNKCYLAHRLTFFMVNGVFPKNQVDHINGNKSDNSFKNLREVTASQNNCNRKSTTGTPTGVYKIIRKNRKGIWYETKIQKDGKSYSSFFRKLEDAIAWRYEKEIKLFGEYRYKGV